MTSLQDELQRIARSPVLLVACDYDGTLSPIVEDPSKAEPVRESLVAIRSLASMPDTHVAVISGRALRDLSRLTGQPGDVHLVGSHGSEFDLDFATALPDEALRLRERVREELSEIVAESNSFRLEEKPASIAFHYRNADEDAAKKAVRRVLDGPASYEGVFTKRGKKVVELAVVGTNKGSALEIIRHRVGATAALYMGDDVTDEDAFTILRGPDVGIKVGDGETGARFRVKDTTEAAQVLAQLCELRSAWLRGSEATPIADHSMLSDHRTAALLTPDARLVWFCAPRIDSPALFAELLGGSTAGYFAVHDAGGELPTDQEYVNGSLILRTHWPNFHVTDYLDCSEGRAFQRAGRVDLIRVIEGTGKVKLEFAPRLDFGRIPTRMREREGGLELEDTLDPIVLRSQGVTWQLAEEGPHQTARAEFQLGDEPLVVELRCGTARLKPPIIPEATKRKNTEAHWTNWSSQLHLPDIEPELVRRSAIILRAMWYGPTGAFIAAPTTSLPENIGGVRNWDYRYCWLRDAALTAMALIRLGSKNEAMKFLDWTLHVLDACPSPERLHPVYSVTGDQLGPEAVINELSGYRGSRPVRIGNAASHQVQLDVFGPIVELTSLLQERGAAISSEHWRVVKAMVKAVGERWHEPDHGIWEVRLARRHHTHSKVMCWLAVDRGLAIAEQTYDKHPEEWITLRDEIANDILERAWCDELKSFTGIYDEPDLDASVLLMGLTGLIDPMDDRFIRTVEAVEKHLREGPVVYRYHYDDGLPGQEGGFHLCTSWLVEAYAKIGRLDDAFELFNAMVGTAGRTGFFSEQYDPRGQATLGNHPQAFSHLGLINNAVLLSEARRESAQSEAHAEN